MLARTRALAPEGTRVSRLAGKSVGVAKSSATLVVGVALRRLRRRRPLRAGRVRVWQRAAAARGLACGAGGGRGAPPGSMVRGSVGWSS